MKMEKLSIPDWNWPAIGVIVAILTLALVVYNTSIGMENRLSKKINNGNHGTDKVYEIIINQQRQIGDVKTDIKTTSDTIEDFIKEHEKDHASIGSGKIPTP